MKDSLWMMKDCLKEELLTRGARRTLNIAARLN